MCLTDVLLSLFVYVYVFCVMFEEMSRVETRGVMSFKLFTLLRVKY